MPSDSVFHNRTAAVLFLVSSGVLLVLLHSLEFASGGLWTSTFFDSLHVPVFAAVALNLFFASGYLVSWSLYRRVIAVLIATLVLSIASEAAQISGPRDASGGDLISNSLGATVGVLLGLAFDTRQGAMQPGRPAYAIAASAVLLLAFTPLIYVSAAYIHRDIKAPVLVSFDTPFSKSFLILQDAVLEEVRDSATGRVVGAITLGNGTWPGVVFHDVWPEWDRYSNLVIELVNDDRFPLEVNFRVHDRIHKQGNQSYDDRFNMAYRLSAGRHTVRIPLTRILEAPKNRQIDLSRIDGIVVFSTRQYSGRTFKLVGIKLE